MTSLFSKNISNLLNVFQYRSACNYYTSFNRASNVVAWENRVVKDKDIWGGEIVLQQLSMNDTDFRSVSQDWFKKLNLLNLREGFFCLFTNECLTFLRLQTKDTCSKI